jgi:hypothetical protein
MSTLPNSLVDSSVQRPARATARVNLALAGFILALLAITALPYVYGYASAPPGRVFQGILFDVPDVAQYWSWMRDHRTSLLVPNRMTAEPNDPALFNMLWLVLGRIQVLTGTGAPAMFQLMRIAGGTAFLLVLWWFAGLLTPDRRQRWTAYLLATLGGGLGWIWVVDKYLSRLADVRHPLDIYVAEPNTFFSLLAQPHFLSAAALLLATFSFFLTAERHGDDWRRYGLATLCALLLGLQHAYDLLIIYFVLGAYVLVQFAGARRVLWGRFWGLAAVGLLSFPPAGYFTLLTTRNPLWKEVLAQFDNAGVFTPNLLHLPILLGLPFIVTLIYSANKLTQLYRRPKPPTPPNAQCSILNAQFLWVWAIVGFGLLYIPTDFQIHMLNPYQVPLALLATQALWQWTSRWNMPIRQNVRWPRIGAQWLVVVLFIAATLPANLYLWSWRVIDLRRAEHPFYLTSDEVAALDWLDARSAERAVVLSGLELGQYVPALTGHRAFLSHWAQTVRFYEKQHDVTAFFDQATPAAARQALLDRYQITYIIYGAEERASGGFDPATAPSLRKVFETPEVTIFQRVDR